MKKHLAFNLNLSAFLLIFGVFVITGCASVETRYKQAESIGTLAAYEEFLKQNPGGVFAEKARSQMEIPEWKQISTQNSIESFRGFLNKYPRGFYAYAAQARISYLEAKQKGLNETYENYLKQYPDKLKIGCEMIIDIKGRYEQGSFKIRIKDNEYMSPNPRNINKAIFVKALGKTGLRILLQTWEGNKTEHTYMTSDKSIVLEKNENHMIKNLKDENEAYGDAFLFLIYKNPVQAPPQGFITQDCYQWNPSLRIIRRWGEKTSNQCFINNLYGFTYDALRSSIDKLVYTDEIKLGGDILLVKERKFVELEPGVFTVRALQEEKG